jgi:hypothetical protein
MFTANMECTRYQLRRERILVFSDIFCIKITTTLTAGDLTQKQR